MLDLDHPQSKHIFTASGLLDRIKLASQAMTVAATPERLRLLDECRQSIEALRRLNVEHFEASDFNRASLAKLEAAFQDLAGDASSDIKASRGAVCPRCGSKLMRLGGYFSRSLCSPCLEAVEAVEYELESEHGFGTIFI